MKQDVAWSNDITIMHNKFKMKDWLENADSYQKTELMKLRMRMLSEEFNETLSAYLQADSEEMIDGLIDLCVIAIGTLDIAGVDPQTAWSEVLRANMDKEVGIKPGRNNPLGLPDLCKPEGWQSPDHHNNHGNLKEFL